MSAAQEHRQTVMTAQGETEVLKGTIDGLKLHIETTVTAINAALDHLSEQVGPPLAQLEALNEAIARTVAAGEAHVNSSSETGHSTHGYAQAAKDDCDNARAAVPGVLELIESITGTLANAKQQCKEAVMAAIAPVETASEGVTIVSGQLEQAETHINQAIHR